MRVGGGPEGSVTVTVTDPIVQDCYEMVTSFHMPIATWGIPVK